MTLYRIAAFSDVDRGGNPAGVMLLDAPMPEPEMRRIAAEVGYSETAFAVPHQGGWRVRYFAPESEVPFCGHATIALGYALGQTQGPGVFDLQLNTARISVEVAGQGQAAQITLVSPPTRSQPATPGELADALALFALAPDDLDPRLPPARIHAGADHLFLALRSRARLAAMTYDLDAGRAVMRRHGWVTVMLVHAADTRAFDVRNAFASGGVLEDPATGAAAAALAGYLRDLGWPHGGGFTLRQGQDMGAPSVIHATLTDQPGAPVRVSGSARWIEG